MLIFQQEYLHSLTRNVDISNTVMVHASCSTIATVPTHDVILAHDGLHAAGDTLL